MISISEPPGRRAGLAPLLADLTSNKNIKSVELVGAITDAL
jgi:hypothetical protein